MTIPSSSLYPSSFDTDDNLYLVHDSLKVRLTEDYNTGDTSITVDGETTRFPETGIITLTEQCSDIELRALSFYYGSRTETTFDDLEILPGFTDSFKPKLATSVVENIMAQHHDNIKNAIIAIENFIGEKGTTDTTPLGDTMEGRTNFLQNLVLKPRAWFSSNKTIGIVPLEITFTDLSFRDPTYWRWCFGDGSTTSISVSVSYIPSVSETVPSGISCVVDLNGNTVTKTFYTPGFYDVSLLVSNSFGYDEIIVENMINARAEAPDEAVLEFVDINANNQIFTEDTDLPTGGVLKSKVNTVINIEVTDNGERPEDPVIEYVWKLSDQLEHFNSIKTEALYDVGGLYDAIVRINTEFDSYRTTVSEEAIDIIEATNMWYAAFTNSNYGVNKQATLYEFGLLSETFKTNNRNSSPTINRDYSFLDGVDNEFQQKKEFLRNASFKSKTSVASGDRGTGYLYWATGYDADTEDWTDQEIKFIEYEGFSDCYATTPTTSACNATHTSSFSRAWNWVSFNTSQNIYFLLGNTNTEPIDSSPTNQDVLKYDQQTLSYTSTTFTSSSYENGADELMANVDNGNAGNFSTYRSAWLNSTGFILRNDANGVYFRIKSFYKTKGILSNLVQTIQKLDDMPGSAKTEGQLVSLVSGVYFFNNSGEVLAYSPTASIWSIGGPGVNSPSFAEFFDSTVTTYEDPTIPGSSILTFDSESQKLIAASDSNRKAYISFDYSTRAFISFNEVTKSFSSLTSRPSGEQWLMTVY